MVCLSTDYSFCSSSAVKDAVNAVYQSFQLTENCMETMSYVGIDQWKLESSGEFIGQYLNGQGNIVVLVILRLRGMAWWTKKDLYEKYPELRFFKLI